MDKTLALALLRLLPELATSTRRDGVSIPNPNPSEYGGFVDWLQKNGVEAPFDPRQHYDYVSAYRDSIGRDAESQHFPDTYKLPGHETFSDESKYATGTNASKAGHWVEDHYVPASRIRRR